MEWEEIKWLPGDEGRTADSYRILPHEEHGYAVHYGYRFIGGHKMKSGCMRIIETDRYLRLVVEQDLITQIASIRDEINELRKEVREKDRILRIELHGRRWG